MEIRHLKLIKTVAEEGTLTKAMEKLFLTQSALSHQLKEVESKIGSPLFSRINKKLVLNSVGKRLLQSAEIILSELDFAQLEIQKMVKGENGTIRISTECYTCYHWLPSVLKQFHAQYPNVEIVIATEATHKPIEKLLAGKLDLGITCDTIENDNVEYRELFEDELVAVIPSNHRLRKKDYLDADDFKAENLIIHSKPLESVTVINKLLMPTGISPKKVIPMPLTEANIEMVKAGMGITTMAKWAFKPYSTSQEIMLKPITKDGMRRVWYAALLKNKLYPEYYTSFLKFLKENISI